MLRSLAFAVACCLAGAASAQDEAPPPDAARALRALGAIWRPIAEAEVASPAAVETACAGAIEELAAVEAMLPAELTPQSLAQVRAPHGLVVVPAGETPAAAYFFPPGDLAWFASGLGTISLAAGAEGRLAIRDAAGASVTVQLGRVGALSALRVGAPTGRGLLFVGCAPTLGP